MRPKSNIMTNNHIHKREVKTMSIEMLTVKFRGGPKGQQRTISIQVEQCRDLALAFKRRSLVDESGKLTEYGKGYVLDAINFLYLRNMVSRDRASLYPITVSTLFNLAKEDPEVRHRLNLLLSELDLPQFQV